MTTQQLPYIKGSDTSKAAAERALPKAGTKRAQVFAFIRSIGPIGATDEEIQCCLGMPGNTQRPRRVELWKAGLIVDSQMRRKTPGGDLAVVWVVA